ncbi:MAG: UUP1 family membrane protein [Proteobacteria bacterium]|nr:UUP1 family membrane protein [Pseudomonadota bacterium]
MRSVQTTLLVFVLMATGVGLMCLKVQQLGLPLLPGQIEPVWSVEAKIEFDASGKGAVVNFDIPDQLGGYILLEEYFVARNYGLNVETDKGDRRAEWSTRRARGKQRLYYRTEIVPQASPEPEVEKGEKHRVPIVETAPEYAEPLKSAIGDVLGETRAESADIFSFVTQLLVKLNNEAPDGNVLVIRDNLDPKSDAWVDRLIYVLAGARISSRLVRGVLLEDGQSDQTPTAWLEVHNGEQWQGFDPSSGDKGYPDNFVRWSVGSEPLLKVDGRNAGRVSFAISQYGHSLASIARDRAAASKSWLSSLLLFDLPVSTQNVYRTLLMIPLGALVVAFMRTLVGIPTLGTFMPILIAVAFRETELVWGIALFVLVTSAGLSIRFYLERLQLLLVPRLCSVLVLVVLLILIISLISARLGLDRGFSIALFPIVILTMVIEHMSVIWEEAGPGAALKEGVGSLLVAVLGYLVMSEDHLQHIVFLFPEVLLILLAVFIVMGRYTGYRVTEVMRFRDIVER